VLADPQRLLHAGEDPLGELHRALLAVELVAQDHELVAAEARDGVARPQHPLQARRERRQELVAGLVAEAVVDDLEVV
jgi:hypothetical protein